MIGKARIGDIVLVERVMTGTLYRAEVLSIAGNKYQLKPITGLFRWIRWVDALWILGNVDDFLLERVERKLDKE